jgi:hypothetical protein
MRFPRHTIVGVIADLRQAGLERDVYAEACVPFAQSGNQSGVLHFRAARVDPASALRSE